MAERLGQEGEKVSRAYVQHCEKLFAEAEAVVDAKKAVLAEKELQHARRTRLRDQGAEAQELVDEAERALQVGRADLAAAERARDRLALEYRASEVGAFCSDGFNNVPYSWQRRDEVLLAASPVRTALGEAKIRRREIERQIAIEETRIERIAAAGLAAPLDGPVWQQFVAEGEYVKQATPLVQILERSQIFLVVSLPIRHFDAVRAGDQATVELPGSREVLRGTTTLMRGSWMLVENESLAVEPPRREAGEFPVIVALRSEDLAGKEGDFCQVGRTARVTFPRRWSPGLFDSLAHWAGRS